MCHNLKKFSAPTFLCNVCQPLLTWNPKSV